MANLSPENEQFLDRAVAVGIYHNRDEALDKAVELLRRREQLIRDVNRRIEQIEGSETEPFAVDEIKLAIQER